MKARRANGIWWFPDSPDQRLAGEFVFDPTDEPSVKIVYPRPSGVPNGSAEMWLVRHNQRIAAMHGVTTDNTKVSLLYGRDGGGSSNSSICTQELKFQVAIWGAHVVCSPHCASYSPAGVSATSIHLEVAHLAQWARALGIGSIKQADSEEPYRFGIEFDPPPDHMVELRDRRVHFSHLPSLSYGASQTVMTQRTALVLEMYTPIAIREAMRGPIYHSQNLLALAFGVTPVTLSVRLDFSPESVVASPDHADANAPVSGELLFASWRNEEKDTHFDFQEAVFMFSDVAPVWRDVLQAAFDAGHSMRPVMQAYFGARFNPAMYTETKFLAMVHALEGFHRHAITLGLTRFCGHLDKDTTLPCSTALRIARD